MPTDTRQVFTLFVFFLGVTLCMWRAPQGYRRHVVLCLVAATLWFGLVVLEPRTRTPSAGFAVTSFLAIGLFKALRGGATRLHP